MQFLWKYIDDLVGKGLEFNLILKLLVLFSFKVVPLALPLSILLSAAMVMGNLGENNELVAYKASGVSTLRVMGSLVLFVSFLGIGAYFFSNNVLPSTNIKFISLLFDIRKHKPALDIKEGIFYRGITGYTFKIAKKSPDNSTIYGIIVYDHTSGYGNDQMIMAEKGKMELSADARYLILNLYDGRQYQDLKRRSSFDKPLNEQTIIEFDSFRKVFDLSEFKLMRTEQGLFKGHQEMLNAKQLLAEVDTVQKQIDDQYISMGQFTGSYISLGRSNPIEIDSTLKLEILDSAAFKNQLSSKPDLMAVQGAILNAESMRSYSEMMVSDKQNKLLNINRFMMEWHKKFTLSFACIILLLIGGSMGAIVRKGGLGMPIVISVVFYMIFHILNITGEKLSAESVVPVYIGMWLPTIVLLPIAILVTYKATTDSVIFKGEWYQRGWEWAHRVSQVIVTKIRSI
jgi:lipopolysaccharide export system permease protein